MSSPANLKLKIPEISKFLGSFDIVTYRFGMTARVETSEIYVDLQRRLIVGDFPNGAKIRPAALMGDYGCSANTVREVLFLLVKDGLVEFALQRGFWVRAISRERCHDITTFRILLEQEGATESMRRGGVAWEAALSAAHHKLSHIEANIARTGVVGGAAALWSDSEAEFHQTLISASASPLLAETFATVYLQFRQQIIGLQSEFVGDNFAVIVAEHQVILDAALARDEAKCRAAIYDHLSRNLASPAQDGIAPMVGDTALVCSI